MKVFIAGPRAVNTLNKDITDILSRIIEKNITVFVGDAAGVDKQVQKYFSSLNYKNVFVYASNGIARNNLGDWKIRSVSVPKNIRGFDFYAQKDIQMAEDADIGFMIWNGKSKGTLNNIINLTLHRKKTMIYLTSNGQTHCISELEKAEKLTQLLGPEAAALYCSLVPAEKPEKTNFEQISLSEMTNYIAK